LLLHPFHSLFQESIACALQTRFAAKYIDPSTTQTFIGLVDLASFSYTAPCSCLRNKNTKKST
jgi:hypothetical protein